VPDVISNYRSVRLIITPGLYAGGKSHFALHAVIVRKGVPHTRALASGLVPYLAEDCSEQEIRAAVGAAALWLQTHR
jgi:hypothetical protein